MLTSFKNYLSLIKFSHTIFALPFALVGYFLGQQHSGANPRWEILIAVVLCMVFARSAAMAFNRFIDEKCDKLNPRTAIREIPAGIVQKNHALWFVIINCLLFVVTTYFINTLCFYLSPIALFVILFYSYTKRFTPLCHLVLGLGLSLAPVGAYLAVVGHFDTIPLLFSAIVFTWVSGFDILYALQDEEFDKANHLKSIPVLLGRHRAMNFSRFLHFITASIVVFIGLYHLPNVYYGVGALLFIGLLFYQHTLLTPTDISKVNLAFGTTNGIASLLFSLFVILSILFH